MLCRTERRRGRLEPAGVVTDPSESPRDRGDRLEPAALGQGRTRVLRDLGGGRRRPPG